MSMSAPLRCAPHALALALWMATTSSVIADEIAAALAAARVTYENEMEALRADVFAELEARDAKELAKPKPDQEKRDALAAERDAFEDAGAWPRSAEKFKRRAAQVKSAMKSAYAAARKANVDAGEKATAAALAAEEAAFAAESDVMPWDPFNLADENNGELGIEPLSISLDERATEPYRIEIIASCGAGAGPLTVGVPAPGGKRVSVCTEDGVSGDVRILLSVRESLISPDLGVARPVNAPTTTEDASNLTLSTGRAGWTLKSVRAKAIADAPSPQPKAKPSSERAARNRPAPRAAPDAQLTPGSTWKGLRWAESHDQPKTTSCRVVSRGANSLELHTTGWDGVGTLKLYFNMRAGGKLTLIDMKYVGENPRVFSEIRGGGAVRGDKLTFTTSSRVAINGQNVFGRGRFELTRE